ncbi:DUF1697 domain-containing protein [Paraburkholderia adhaesiva]|uniref:DUF1697 domain-containing protein n=1 Tax=Paraburkholderia adhaesiva TaxID=2883244 RepID=UPI001F398A0A|nr:DUF1697 domain-containing protein [Paraburkholderia adhaesiva]
MQTYVAFLRAVNVGGTGKLPMIELRAMCERAGFDRVRTYVASGNVVFQSAFPETKVKVTLERALQAYAGKPVGVMVRTGAEMAGILKANPFGAAPPDRTVAIFLDEAPPADTLTNVSGSTTEEIALGKREIYVHYPEGIGRSKLKIAAARTGTARNMNTVAKLAEWTAE